MMSLVRIWQIGLRPSATVGSREHPSGFAALKQARRAVCTVQPGPRFGRDQCFMACKTERDRNQVAPQWARILDKRRRVRERRPGSPAAIWHQCASAFTGIINLHCAEQPAALHHGGRHPAEDGSGSRVPHSERAHRFLGLVPSVFVPHQEGKQNHFVSATFVLSRGC
jgi:hypothetical protein